MADSIIANRRNSTLPFYIGAVLLVLAAAIAVASYSVELGLSKPNTSARRVVVSVAEIDAALKDEADFAEYSSALYAGLGAYESLAVYTAADNRVDHAMSAALDCYTALRESWQMELEGSWDPAIQGDSGYWRSFHDAVRLPGETTLTREELKAALWREARAYTDEALAIVERQ